MKKNRTVNQAIDQIGIGRTKFYELLNEGYIKAIKIGSRTLVPQSSIDEYLKSLPEYTSKGGISDEK